MNADQTVCVTKGMRVRVHRETAYLPCLAGMQMKVGLKVEDFVGVVRHVRGDHPTNPTKIMIYVDPEGDTAGFTLTRAYGCACEKEHVEVDPKHIVEVLPRL